MIDKAIPTVAIIVLTWNQRDLTLDCLASLTQMDFPSDQLQIIVVDNGSSDDTAEAIREHFPSATLLENDDNLGFAEGNNIGIREALRGPADYIMLLNNDTVVDTSMLKDLLVVLKSDPSVGIVGPKMLYHDPPDVIWCAGNEIDWRTGNSIRLQADQIDDVSEEELQEVDYITGCGICLRRQVIEQIGLIDPRFFIYLEERDWCVRAYRSGWKVIYVPRARLWHKVSAAMGIRSPATEYYMTRNVFLFLMRNASGWARIRSLAYATMRGVLTILAYTVKSQGGQRTAHRNARILAFRDALLGRWGKMGPDVARVCYRENQ